MEGKEEQKRGGQKMPAIVFLIAALVVFLAPVPSMAHRQKFDIDFGGSHIRGSRGNPGVLPLKKELMRQYPGVDVSQLRLQRIIVVARPVKGRGFVQLVVGRQSSPTYRIEGGRSHRHDRQSFGIVEIVNPFRQSWGPWQLILNGDFIVHKVVLEVESRRDRRHGGFVLPLARSDDLVFPEIHFHGRRWR